MYLDRKIWSYSPMNFSVNQLKEPLKVFNKIAQFVSARNHNWIQFAFLHHSGRTVCYTTLRLSVYILECLHFGAGIQSVNKSLTNIVGFRKKLIQQCSKSSRYVFLYNKLQYNLRSNYSPIEKKRGKFRPPPSPLGRVLTIVYLEKEGRLRVLPLGTLVTGGQGTLLLMKFGRL